MATSAMITVPLLLSAPVRAVRRVEDLGRRCISACVLLCYVAGTVGLPAPSLGAIAANGACRCSPASVLAGTCCCHNPGATRSCCADKSARPFVRPVLQESGKSSARSCCQPKATTASTTHDDKNELRVSTCPCGPTAPDGSLMCTDPRLPIAATLLSIELPVGEKLPIASLSAPRGALEPQTPPPKA
ncbi:MAG: hypothetical protein JNG89_05105 [Planctomycetaceae bacterium]|nr:hypothetical protein [Planctomycetaceae bacterium]